MCKCSFFMLTQDDNRVQSIQKNESLYMVEVVFSFVTLFCIHIISQIPYQSTLRLNKNIQMLSLYSVFPSRSLFYLTQP